MTDIARCVIVAAKRGRRPRGSAKNRVFARGLCACANRAANEEQRVEEQQLATEAHHAKPL